MLNAYARGRLQTKIITSNNNVLVMNKLAFYISFDFEGKYWCCRTTARKMSCRLIEIIEDGVGETM